MGFKLSSLQLGLAAAGVVALGVLVWYIVKKRKESKKESFSALSPSSVVSLGSLDDGYQLADAPEMDAPEQHGQNISYADIVPGDEHSQLLQPQNVGQQLRPTERLHRLQGKSLMPRISRNVTPYNIDVADQSIYSFAVNAPRVQIRSQQWVDNAGHLSTAIRGDIPIKYHPEVSMVGRSKYGRDEHRLDGLFSDHFKALSAKYGVSGYHNMPIKVANNGVIMDGY